MLTRSTIVVFLLLGSATPASAVAEGEGVVAVQRSEFTVTVPSGTVSIQHTWGQLTVEGWDRPTVQVIAKAGLKRNVAGRSRELELLKEGFGFEAKRSKDGGVLVTGICPRSSVLRPFGGKGSVDMAYVVKIPRSASLALRHGAGSASVFGLVGNIDAAVQVGDLNVILPRGTAASIDGSARVGEIDVSSEFQSKGLHHRRLLVGDSFALRAPVEAQRVVARVGVGSVTIGSKGGPLHGSE